METKVEEKVGADLSQLPELQLMRLQLAAAKGMYDLHVHQNRNNELGLVSEVDGVKVDLASTLFEDLPQAHRAALVNEISEAIKGGSFYGVGIVADSLNLPCYLVND